VKHQVLNKIQMMPTLPVQSMTIQQVIHPCLMNKMLPGDKIISLNQMPVNNVMSLIYLLNTKNHDEMVIGLKNKSEEKTFYFQPGIKDGQNVLGVTFQLVPQTTGQLSIPDALDYVIDDINRAFKLQFLVLWGLLIGQLSLSDLSGPIGLYQAFQGIVSWYVMGDYLLLLGKINLILGLFNLLPIPPLDGGALFMRFFVWGKNAVAIRNLITNIGLIIIIELGIYTTLNDMNLLGSEQDVSPHFVNRCD
jgi:RIP metalloprotease RseP